MVGEIVRARVFANRARRRRVGWAMRITCSACGTKYEVRDERVAGRVVKLRCKRCGEVVVIDASAPARTGERNESSVLFSLAMLARHDPEPPAPPAPAPVDDIVNLSAGGPFAPAFAAPVLPVEPPPDPPRAAWRIGLAIGAGLVALAALPLAVYAAIARRPPGPASTAPPITATEPAPATATATVTATVAAAATATAQATATPTAKLANVAPPTIAHPVPPPPACCPGETATACAMRRSVGAACPDAPAFDAAAARRALASVDIASCKRPGGPSGSGHVRVTFASDGAAVSATTDAPYGGTAVGRCVEGRYRGVRVPAFTGGPLAVGKSFAIE